MTNDACIFNLETGEPQRHHQNKDDCTNEQETMWKRHY
jgi:hypothetical protein